MLSGIKRDGANFFVVTAKPKVFAEHVVSYLGIGDHFKRIYGSKSEGRRSDKTALICYVLEQERLPSDKTIMVGDRHYDIIGAKANGIHSAAVLWGNSTKGELSACEPDMLVGTPTDLIGELGRLWP
ncbi:hypothetical protein DSCOOX_61030 [Desulfosarcina ovata subsp. ovata]|uniref:Phosphoglycolate phosphatase n=2 Tax=Desulfosarcina ovata TaxID=83564 RepID=A0A5K8AJN5_9BACT|nr:hypothetical protein DSCOOX_61030 [Desulfosarcina ovata subsp. ovata]